jgi:hypothetical protein
LRKKSLFLVIVLAIVSLPALSDEMSPITVKKSELNNGVVIVQVLKSGNAFELQCNQGSQSCAKLQPGKYQMAELPKNWGLYDCKDVQVYPESGDKQDDDRKLGEYCLIEPGH